MRHFERLGATAQSLSCGGQELEQAFEDFKAERALQFTMAAPNLMAEIPEERKLIILIDIVGFSKSPTREQVYTIYLFQRYLTTQVLSNRFSFRSKIRINHFVPTGDGCYIVAEECAPDTALAFLVALVGGFKEIAREDGRKLALRASALLGSCVPFIDMAKHRNYVGEGMNEASRILSGGQKALEQAFRAENPSVSEDDAKAYSRNSLYLGDSLASAAPEYADDCTKILLFKDVTDKHGKSRDVTVLQGIL